MQNKWVNLIAGIIIQTILGGIYAWSVFVPYLINEYGLSKGQCGSIFGASIGVFTVAMIFGGRTLTKKGPAFTAGIGSVLFFTGYLVASFSGGSFLLLLLGISVLSGSGIGFGYVCPLSVGMKWFPKHKGLITGIAVAGFGGGAVILSSIASAHLSAGMDVLVFFRWLALFTGVMLIVSSLPLAVPEGNGSKGADVNVGPSLKSIPFWGAFASIFAGTFSGLLVIGNLAPIGIDAGFAESVGVTAVSLFAVGNALGRVTWGFLFDRLNYKTIPLSLIFFALFILLLNFAFAPWVFLLTAVMLGFGFGANFVIYASALSRFFGSELFPKIYPFCFLGYGIAGITGPSIGGAIADKTGSYQIAIYMSSALLIFAFITVVFGARRYRTLRNA